VTAEEEKLYGIASTLPRPSHSILRRPRSLRKTDNDCTNYKLHFREEKQNKNKPN